MVKLEDPNPPKTGGYDPEWSEWKSAFVSTAPIYAYCDPSNPVGWIEGEEVYQVMPKKWAEKMNGIWTDCSKVIYDDYRKDNIFRRIWIEPRKQPDFQREAEELYPNTRSNGNDIYHNNDLADAQQEAHIKARQMSEQEIRELREELEAGREKVRRLREGLNELMIGVDGLPPLTAIAGVLEKQYSNAKQLLTDIPE